MAVERGSQFTDEGYFLPTPGNAFYDPKEDGQPWLFSPEELGIRPRDWMSDDKRYPRGFTPERQREVTDALSDTDFSLNPDPNDPSAAHEEEAFIRQAIARSGVPAEELRGLRGVRTEDVKIPGAQGSYDPNDNVLNVYQSLGKKRFQPEGSVQSPNDISKVLIHELGHHNDSKTATDPAITPRFEFDSNDSIALAEQGVARTAARTGAQEARADNYMDDYGVDDPRFPKSTIRSGYTANADKITTPDISDKERQRAIKYFEQAGAYGQRNAVQAIPRGSNISSQFWASGFLNDRNPEALPGIQEGNSNMPLRVKSLVNTNPEPTLFDSYNEGPRQSTDAGPSAPAAPAEKPGLIKRLLGKK